jgi:hypothetical protein
MPRHPIDGIKGGKPRLPIDGKPANKAEVQRLSREYLVSRNAQMVAKAAMTQMEAAAKRGELISKRLAVLQTGYLLTCFRQRVLTEPVVLARRLVSAGFLVEEKQHEAQEMIKADLCAMLEELADLPFRISDPNWIEKIDADLRVEDDGESGGRVADPSGIRRKDEQAKRRRQQKIETQRRRRAEGRINLPCAAR